MAVRSAGSWNLLDLMKSATRIATDAAGVTKGTLAYFQRGWWQQPLPDTIAVQLNWAARPAYGRKWKFFSGHPAGTLPNDNSYGLQGLGLILFRGLIVRRLTP